MQTFHIEASPHNVEIPALEAMRNDNHWVLDRRIGENPIRVTGRLLGFGSSRRTDHNHPIARDIVPRTSTRCPACRWFEVRILRISDSDEFLADVPYIVHTLGPSLIPGERTFVRANFAVTGFEVIELCTVRQGDRGEPYMPAGAARALSQAAGVDRDIQDAYVNRAVA